MPDLDGFVRRRKPVKNALTINAGRAESDKGPISPIVPLRSEPINDELKALILESTTFDTDGNREDATELPVDRPIAALVPMKRNAARLENFGEFQKARTLFGWRINVHLTNSLKRA